MNYEKQAYVNQQAMLGSGSGIMGGAAAVMEPPSMREVLDQMSSAIGGLAASVEGLEEKLSPVLLLVPEKEGANHVPVPVAGSDMVRAIQQMISRLHNIEVQVHRINRNAYI